MEYGHYLTPGRDAYLYPEAHDERLNLTMELTVLEYIYINPNVVSRTTSSQFGMVGLQNELGMHVTTWLDVYLGHESLHIQDRPHEFLPRFPVADWAGVRFNIFTTQKSTSTIFP